MRKQSINPFKWHWADDQGILVEGMNHILFISGQTAMSDEGKPMHPNDMLAQVKLALTNVETVLGAANMDFSNVVSMNTYVTDVDRFQNEASEAMAKRLAKFDVRPPGVLSEVVKLGHPDLIVEIAATAVR